MTVENLDLIAGWAGLILTLMIFSYLLADNFLYRIAVHVLVGTTAAFVAIAAVDEVILPWIEVTILNNDDNVAVRAIGIVPLFFALLLLLKSIPRFATASVINLSNAFLIGIGTGVALVGVVVGTILQLGQDTSTSLDESSAINGVLLLAGTICTLIYFQYLSRKQFSGDPNKRLPLRVLGAVGQGFVTVTLGALYATAILTSLSIFSTVFDDQLRFLLDQIGS